MRLKPDQQRTHRIAAHLYSDRDLDHKRRGLLWHASALCMKKRRKKRKEKGQQIKPLHLSPSKLLLPGCLPFFG